MSKQNDYMTNNFGAIHRKSCLDRSIFDWITSARYHIPGLSVEDCAKSFLSFHKIDEGELSIYKIRTTYNRIQKEIYDDLKTKDDV